jgi:hypothetical protein
MKIQTILANEIFPVNPRTPIVVVKMRIIGPTSARELLTKRAFSTELNLIMSIAASISILPESTLNKAIPKTAISIKINIFSSYVILFIPHPL